MIVRAATAGLLVLAMAGAAAAASPVGRWVAVEIGGVPVARGVETTLDLDLEGNVSGKGGCNRYGGRATVGDGTIGFGMMQATQRACQPPAGDQEGRFHRALTRATGWQVDGDRLVLTDAGGKPLARFLRAR
jgi:putative lipoprotein